MNFDQKAVKFLANFYINGGKHWTHGPLGTKLRPAQLNAAVSSCPGPGATWGMCPPGVQEVPRGLRTHLGSLQESWPPCAGGLKALWRERRPPIVTDPDNPGPAQYQVPDASLRECTPHPRFSIGRRRPAREGGGRRAWQTAWFQSDSPFTQKADFRREQKWPSPADYRPPSSPASPSFSFGGRRSAPRTGVARARPGLLRALGAGHRVRPLLQAPPQPPGEKRPGPDAYDVLPGNRLRSPRPPAFSMSRSPAFASWVNPSRSPGPAAYDVEDCYNSRFPTAPGVLIQGVRRPKRHDTGPFCSI